MLSILSLHNKEHPHIQFPVTHSSLPSEPSLSAYLQFTNLKKILKAHLKEIWASSTILLKIFPWSTHCPVPRVYAPTFWGSYCISTPFLTPKSVFIFYYCVTNHYQLCEQNKLITPYFLGVKSPHILAEPSIRIFPGQKHGFSWDCSSYLRFRLLFFQAKELWAEVFLCDSMNVSHFLLAVNQGTFLTTSGYLQPLLNGPLCIKQGRLHKILLTLHIFIICFWPLDSDLKVSYD